MTSLRLLAALGVAASIPGCTLFGDDAEVSRDPVLDGPHFLFVVENVGEHAATVDFRLFGPQGMLRSTGNVTAPAGETVVKPVAVEDHGTQRLDITYQWTAQGQAASGSDTTTFSTLDCLGTVRIRFVVDPTPGETIHQIHTSCEDA